LYRSSTPRTALRARTTLRHTLVSFRARTLPCDAGSGQLRARGIDIFVRC
jgi:hypothetical protein